MNHDSRIPVGLIAAGIGVALVGGRGTATYVLGGDERDLRVQAEIGGEFALGFGDGASLRPSDRRW